MVIMNLDEYYNHGRALKENCKFLYQLKIVIIVLILNIFTGATVGNLSSLLRKVAVNELDFPTTKEDAATLSNTASLSTLLGPVVFTYCMNHIGRKYTLMLILIPTIVQYGLIYSTDSISLLTLAVSIGYIPVLITPPTIAIYMAEISSPHLRGSFANVLTSNYSLGVVFGLVLNWTLPLKQSSSILFCLLIIYGGVMIFLPKTPHYLIKTGQISEAKKVLKCMYDQKIVDVELTRLEDHINKEKVGKLKDIFLDKKNRKSLFILLNIYFLKYCSGTIILCWFAPFLLTKGKYKLLSPFSCELMILISLIFVSLAGSVLYRYIPRKPIGLIASVFLIITLLLQSIYFYLLDSGNEFLSNINDFLPFLLLLLCQSSAIMGVVPLAFTYIREITPIKYVAYYSFILDMAVPILNTITTIIFNRLMAQFGVSASFAFFLICAVIGTVIFYLYAPETHKKVLEQIQDEII